jgi:hypothetical protein
MDRDEMSNLYRGPCIDTSYQVSVHVAEGFQRRRLKCEKLTDDRRRTPSDGNSSPCLWQGGLIKKLVWNFDPTSVALGLCSVMIKNDQTLTPFAIVQCMKLPLHLNFKCYAVSWLWSSGVHLPMESVPITYYPSQENLWVWFLPMTWYTWYNLMNKIWW